MFGLMRVSTHDRIIDEAVAKNRRWRMELENRLAAAVGRNLIAQNTISELRPAADKWNAKLERDRIYAANKRRAAK